MDYNRIYEYRFKDVNKHKKLITWNEISTFIFKELKQPQIILDPAAGECEFINSVPCKEKWAVDLNSEFISKYAEKGVNIKIGDSLKPDLPSDYFDAVFISNFLEHLNSHEEINMLLINMFNALHKGGRIAVMGPNFKYCQKEYFDFADHKMILTHLSLEEHIYNAGFKIIKVVPKFLPVSFRGRLPINKLIVRTYLAIPLLWKLFGKQFLVIAEK
jgi:ubiquinone/menaquinone biosynthesis C-methylase UbiE